MASSTTLEASWGPAFPSILALLRLFNLAFPGRRSPVLENLALRQQIAVYRRRSQRPQLRQSDHLFLLGLARFWRGWRDALVIVQPETVVGWHRKVFRRYWRWMSRYSDRVLSR